jgi:hypothetical protein
VTRFPAALALFALLSPTATAEPCAPRVELAGDREAIARVAVELKALGVVLGAIEPVSRSCSVNAMVALEGEGLSISVQTSSRRSEGRVVGDAKVAAAWIDSWLRDEIEVSSWAIAAPPPATPSTLTAMQAPMSTSATTVAPEVAAPAPSILERVGLSLVVERSWTNDDTEWNGFDVAGCMRLGTVCVGGRVRASFQDDLAYLSTTADRSDIVALATASMPFTVGQVSIAPEVGLGVGRVRTQRDEACSAPQPPAPSPGCADPMDPTCMMNPDDPVTGGGTGNECLDAAGNPTNQLYVGDNYDESSYLPRVALALRLSFPIVRHVWLDAVASYTLTPFTPRTGFEEPNTMTMDPPTDPTTAMPPEPDRGYQLGVGIRVGIP